MNKYLWAFNEGTGDMSEILGTKASNLAAMTKMGLPVSFGFTVSFNACERFYQDDKRIGPDIRKEIVEKLNTLRDITGSETVSLRPSMFSDIPGIRKAVLNVPSDDVNNMVTLIGEFFTSWNSEAAVYYRKAKGLSNQPKVAVIVQAMVAENRNSDSGTGTVFTRDPETGSRELSGVYYTSGMLMETSDLKKKKPDLYNRILKVSEVIEKYLKDVQRISYIVDNGSLYIMESETASRSVDAEIRTAVDMVHEGLIDKKTALLRINTGKLPSVKGNDFSPEMEELLSWADEERDLRIMATCYGLTDAEWTMKNGADGVGFFRFEKGTGAAGPDDFKRVYDITGDLPVAMRLSDCRLAVINPDIIVKQVEGIIGAAIEKKKERNMDVIPQIMIPLAGSAVEMENIRRITVEKADKMIQEAEVKLNYEVGCMIETPRAALIAGDLAKTANFFGFDAEDLTRYVFGFTGRNTKKIIKEYVENGFFENNPFTAFDIDGVGELVEKAVKTTHQIRKNFRNGLLMDWCGDIETVEFCRRIGMNYISCAPEQVAAVRIMAAQAAIKDGK